MSNTKIQSLLEQLQQELASTELDPTTKQLLQEFDAATEIQMTDATTSNNESLVETAKQLETHFAVEHPLAERCMREIIEALGKMGI